MMMSGLLIMFRESAFEAFFSAFAALGTTSIRKARQTTTVTAFLKIEGRIRNLLEIEVCTLGDEIPLELEL